MQQNQLKVYSSAIDLHTLEFSSLNELNGNLPDLIMPTAHAREYAIIDFVNCKAGTYLITGLKDQKEIIYTIIFKKD